jgi:hypothetical protein
MIITNILIFIVLSVLICFAFWGNWKDLFSIVGSVASIQGVIIALIELKKVKTSTEAAMEKLCEVARLFSYADIERHIEMCSYISVCLINDQYEAAALRMSDLKKLLCEMKSNETKVSQRSQNIQDLIRSIGVDIEAVRGKTQYNEKLDIKLIQKHVNSVSTLLQEVSAGIKQEIYVA